MSFFIVDLDRDLGFLRGSNLEDAIVHIKRCGYPCKIIEIDGVRISQTEIGLIVKDGKVVDIKSKDYKEITPLKFGPEWQSFQCRSMFSGSDLMNPNNCIVSGFGGTPLDSGACSSKKPEALDLTKDY